MDECNGLTDGDSNVKREEEERGGISQWNVHGQMDDSL